VQQARGEDETPVTEAYARLGVKAEVAPFFSDLPARIGALDAAERLADLVLRVAGLFESSTG
jgi:hypothetical protein